MNEDDNFIWRGLEARIERLEDVVRDLDEAIRGNRHKKMVGLLPDQDRMDLELRKINAILFQDPTGQKGLLHDVDFLMGRRKYDNDSREIKWKFWGPIIIVLITQGVLILLNLDKIKQNLPLYHPAPLEAAIDQARHPKGKKIYRIRHVQEEAPSDDTKESLQK